MKYEKIATLLSGQDGAIFGDTLFRFGGTGWGRAYPMDTVLSTENKDETLTPESFPLDQKEIICPHSNAVFFGREKFAPEDKFPLLYSNIYNNYSKAEDRRPGQLLAYRIWYENGRFFTKLVQLIEVGFAYDTQLWMSYGNDEEERDIRPYGNFVADPENGKLYAFVMRDKERITRYFSFRLPTLSEGEIDSQLGIKKVVLGKEDILDSFDTPYHCFIQGACFHDGKIYSTEGFGEKEGRRSAIRIVDVEKKCQVAHFDLVDAGLPSEPEWIEFYEGKCYYSNAKGILYRMEF